MSALGETQDCKGGKRAWENNLALTVGMLNADTIGDMVSVATEDLVGDVVGVATEDTIGDIDGSGVADARVGIVVLVDEIVAVTVVRVGVTIGCGDNVGM